MNPPPHNTGDDPRSPDLTQISWATPPKPSSAGPRPGPLEAPGRRDATATTRFAWHDCYGEITPPDDVVDDILICSRGDLAQMIRVPRLAVEDSRDLRMAAHALRAEDR